MAIFCSVMETDRLRQFCVISEVGSLTQAANLLGMTHSALSKSMRTLQLELGQRLLQPKGRGLTLTRDGLRIYERAKELLLAEEKLRSPMQPEGQLNLRIGSSEVFLPLIINGIKSRPFGSNTITLLDLEPGSMEHKIAIGQLDFGVTYAPFLNEKVEVTQIGTLSSGCYHHKDAFEGIAFSDLPFIVPATELSSNPLNIRERDGWLDEIFPRKKAFHVNLLSSGLTLAAQGLGAIYIPHFLAKIINENSNENILTQKKLPPNYPQFSQFAYALWHRDRPEDALSRRFCSILRSML